MTTVALPPYVESNGLFVQADGSRLVSNTADTILVLSRFGRPAVVARSECKSGFKDGKGHQRSRQSIITHPGKTSSSSNINTPPTGRLRKLS